VPPAPIPAGVVDVLIDAVLAGAARVLDVRRSGQLHTHFKDAAELVTEADRQSDAAMLDVLRTRATAIDSAISFRLEESGATGTPGPKRIGADPLDGTSHFAAGGHLYSVQAYYGDEGVPLAAVILQPVVFLPLAESPQCLGRLVWATRGGGAFVQRTTYAGSGFTRGEARRIVRRPDTGRRTLVACVPVTTKMTAAERAMALRVHDSGLVGATTAAGNAGGNVLMIVFGGQDVYANFGAGEELDLAPPQVIAEEIGLTVWTTTRRPPVWTTRKQPFIVAPDAATAERFLHAAGL
jgi:3'-phosphoadenosine 5'-phosphosulfate (PAPS) 3'-phosphatase